MNLISVMPSCFHRCHYLIYPDAYSPLFYDANVFYSMAKFHALQYTIIDSYVHTTFQKTEHLGCEISHTLYLLHVIHLLTWQLN